MKIKVEIWSMVKLHIYLRNSCAVINSRYNVKLNCQKIIIKIIFNNNNN